MNTKNMKPNWLRTAVAALSVSLAALGAQCAETILIDEVSNHYPWDGKVDCAYTLSGTSRKYLYEGVFTLSVKKNGEIVSKTVTNAFESADGSHTNTFDCAEIFGEGLYSDGGITLALVRDDAVQLWKDGPYWATCNVGADVPEEYGYYFWWGDTVGYTNRSMTGEGGAWYSVDDGTTTIEFAEKDATANQTHEKTIQQLLDGKWIEISGSETNLVAAHDAATGHWGAKWRMPTYAESSKLVDTNVSTRVCTSVWTTVEGVYGCRVFGVTEGYENKSIFLPAVGLGSGNELTHTTLLGNFWSSVPDPGYDVRYQNHGLGIVIGNGVIGYGCASRYLGFPVRPVREGAK